MNITLTDKQLSGLSFATAKRNAANPNSAPMSDEEFAADLLGVQLDAFAKQQETALLDLMRPVGAEIAAAAGGDPENIASALEAGKTAALAALQS